MKGLLLCPKCGNRLRKFEKEKGQVFGICINDHRIPLEPSEAKLTYKIQQKEEKERDIIIREEEKEEIDSIFSCPKCGSKKCKILYSFTPWGDEESVRIAKCLKCGKHFREGFGG